MTTDVFIDIETMGTVPGSAIISIGAVRFTKQHGLCIKPHDVYRDEEHRAIRQAQCEFYRECTVASNGQMGLRLNDKTLAWWMDQPDAARKTLKHSLLGEAPAIALNQALGDLKGWLETGDDIDTIWCYGASFDFPMLEIAFDRGNAKAPWDYKQLRCARTLFALTGLHQQAMTGTAHNALDDAKRDAEHTAKCLLWIDRAKQEIADADHRNFLRESGLSRPGEIAQTRQLYDALDGTTVVTDTTQICQPGGCAPPVIRGPIYGELVADDTDGGSND